MLRTIIINTTGIIRATYLHINYGAAQILVLDFYKRLKTLFNCWFKTIKYLLFANK